MNFTLLSLKIEKNSNLISIDILEITIISDILFLNLLYLTKN